VVEVFSLVGCLVLKERLQSNVRRQKYPALPDVVGEHGAGIEQTDVLDQGPVSEHGTHRQIVSDRPEVQPGRGGRGSEKRRRS
jgi:hypothetical protein